MSLHLSGTNFSGSYFPQRSGSMWSASMLIWMPIPGVSVIFPSLVSSKQCLVVALKHVDLWRWNNETKQTLKDLCCCSKSSIDLAKYFSLLGQSISSRNFGFESLRSSVVPRSWDSHLNLSLVLGPLTRQKEGEYAKLHWTRLPR